MSEVRNGFHQTELGLVPMDWSISELKELCEFENGDRGVNYPSATSFVEFGVPFINAGHLSGREIQPDELDYITPQHFEILRSGKVRTDDTLFCLRGSIGKFGNISNNFGQGAIASSLIIVRAKPRKLVRDFLLTYFGARTCQLMIERWAGGAAQPNLGGKELERFLIALPPLPEQQAIAEALGDVDGLIAALEALIAKKRDIKQGAMQDLLSAHRRLPGFTGEWANVSLKAISAFITKGSTPTTYGFGWVDNGILFLRSECVSKDGLELDQSMMISEEAHGVLSRSEIKAGDLLITITGNVGRVVFLDDGFPDANINQHIARIRISHPEVEARFVYHYLKQDRCLKYFNSITTGQAYPQLSLRQVRDMIIPLPRKDEQSAISVTLSSMDAEIAALETKLAKTRDVKQGMMQVLLTGEVRLV